MHSGRGFSRIMLYLGSSLAAILAVILVFLNLRIISTAEEYPVKPLYLIIAELLFLLQVVLVGLRLFIILSRGFGYGLSIRELIEVSVAQTFASLIIPGFYIGGEAVSIAYLTRRGIPTSRATESVVLRYTVDSIVVAAIAITIAIFRAPVPYIALGFSTAILISYITLFMVIIGARLGNYLEGLLRWASAKFKALSRFIIFDSESRRIMLGVPDYVALFTLSLLQWILAAASTHYILLSLGATPSFIESLIIVSSYVALTYISLLPGSAGIGELANLYILNNLGLGEYYLGYVIWFRVITYVVPLMLFLPLFLKITHAIGAERP